MYKYNNVCVNPESKEDTRPKHENWKKIRYFPPGYVKPIANHCHPWTTSLESLTSVIQ